MTEVKEDKLLKDWRLFATVQIKLSALVININIMTTNPGKQKCCLRWIYANLSLNPGQGFFQKEANGKENPNIPVYSATTVKLLADLLQNPDAWREERDNIDPMLPGVGPKTGRVKQRGTFCGDTLKDLEGPPQYDWSSDEVG
jgi:hypothetical protein